MFSTSSSASGYSSINSAVPSGQYQDPPVTLEETVREVADALGRYARQHPEVGGGLIFLLGVYVGWKIKPW